MLSDRMMDLQILSYLQMSNGFYVSYSEASEALSSPEYFHKIVLANPEFWAT